MSSAEPEKDARAAASEPAAGFHAKLEGASLWDLVQMECLARSRLAVEVTGEGGVGHLYFDAGRVVHASTQRQRGLSAALEILGWTHGTFQASQRGWPSAPTIDMSHEGLLLHAAALRDERGASNLVAFPGRALEPAVDAALEDVEIYEVTDEADGEGAEGTRTNEEDGMRNPSVDQAPPPPLGARAESAADFPVMLRLSGQGAVLRNKGGSDELAEAIAYAHRLVQLTGDLLGLEDFVAFECSFGSERVVVFTENEGEIVALRPRADLNLAPLRERLGL